MITLTEHYSLRETENMLLCGMANLGRKEMYRMENLKGQIWHQ